MERNGEVRILVVEASELALEAIQAELGSMKGVKIVGSTPNASSVIAHIDALAPDLVISSIDLDEGDGFELYSALRQQRPELDVLLFDTTFRMGPIVDEAGDTGTHARFVAACVVATQLVPKVRSLYAEATMMKVDA